MRTAAWWTCLLIGACSHRHRRRRSRCPTCCRSCSPTGRSRRTISSAMPPRLRRPATRSRRCSRRSSATLPPSLSSAGFSYHFNSMLGTAERASSSFGSFFTERSLTSGRGQAALGMNVRMASYTRLDGRDLRDGSFLTTANQFRDEAGAFDVETLTLDIDSRVADVHRQLRRHRSPRPHRRDPARGTVDDRHPRQHLSRPRDGAGRGRGHVARLRRRRGAGQVRAGAAEPSSGLAVAGELRLPTGRERGPPRRRQDHLQRVSSSPRASAARWATTAT